MTRSASAVETAILPPTRTSWTFFFVSGRTTTVSFMANGTLLAVAPVPAVTRPTTAPSAAPVAPTCRVTVEAPASRLTRRVVPGLMVDCVVPG